MCWVRAVNGRKTMLSITLGECSQLTDSFLLFFRTVKDCSNYWSRFSFPEHRATQDRDFMYPKEDAKVAQELVRHFEGTLRNEWTAMRNHIAIQKAKKKRLIKQLT